MCSGYERIMTLAHKAFRPYPMWMLHVCNVLEYNCKCVDLNCFVVFFYLVHNKYIMLKI